MGDPTTTPASGETPRATWQLALVALAILFVISELGYIAAALIARSSIDGGATAHDGLVGALSNGFFMYAASDTGPPIFTLKTFFGLPGFNTLYFLVFGPLDTGNPMPFVTSGLAAPLVGLLALFGQLSISSGRGVAVSMLAAALFAVVWVVLYTAAEASMYGDAFWSEFNLHILEIPVAFVSLLAVSIVTRRRS